MMLPIPTVAQQDALESDEVRRDREVCEGLQLLSTDQLKACGSVVAADPAALAAMIEAEAKRRSSEDSADEHHDTPPPWMAWVEGRKRHAKEDREGSGKKQCSRDLNGQKRRVLADLEGKIRNADDFISWFLLSNLAQGELGKLKAILVKLCGQLRQSHYINRDQGEKVEDALRLAFLEVAPVLLRFHSVTETLPKLLRNLRRHEIAYGMFMERWLIKPVKRGDDDTARSYDSLNPDLARCMTRELVAQLEPYAPTDL